MQKAYVNPPKGDPNFPAMKWHPQTAENRIFHKAEDVPEGWLDTHPKNVTAAEEVEKTAYKPAVKAPAAKSIPMDRKEILAALADGGVTPAKNASNAQLYSQLQDALKLALTEMGKEFPADADAKALLELLPKPE